MEISQLQHREIGILPQIILDYLDAKKELSPFVDGFPQEANWQSKSELRSFPKKHREVLHQALIAQYEAHSRLSSYRKKNIDLLLEEDVFTVCTGHQLNLFTGPAFFFYKVIATIKLAQQLETEHGVKVLPVFWMASEDHDWEEINHTHVFRQKIQWEKEAQGAVGMLSIDGIDPLFEEMCEILKWEEGHLMREQYASWKAGSSSLADFHFKMVDDLFGSDELIVIEPNNSVLKQLFVPAMLKEIREQAAFDLVQKSSSELEKLDFTVQVNPRKINLFYLSESSRKRIDVDGEGGFFETGGEKRWTLSEIEKEIQAYPERFSPNVVLRPLYQEIILPNLAYIGGPGELAYWMQLKGVFQDHETPFPQLILRNNVLVLSASSKSKLEKLELELQDLFKNREAFIADWSDRKGGVSLGDAEKDLERLFEGILQKALSIDPNLEGTVAAALQRQKKELDGLEKRFRKAIKQQESVSIRQIEALFDAVYPKGSFQERQQNFFALNEMAGGELKSKLMNSLPVLTPELSVIFV